MKKLVLTISIILCLCFSVQATEKILYPNANGTYQQFSSTGASHYTEVDEADGVEDTSTYLYYTEIVDGLPKYETEGFEDCGSVVNGDSIPDFATIDSVRLQCRVKIIGTLQSLVQMYWNTTITRTITPTTSYVNYFDKQVFRITTPWTKALVNALECGLYTDGYCVSNCGTVYLTQLHLHVFYTKQEILYPTAAGTYQDFTASVGTHWECLDDLDGVANPDDDYVSKATSASEDYRETEALANVSIIPSGFIADSVVIHLRAKRSATLPGVTKFLWYDGTTQVIGGAYTTTTSFVDKRESRTTNLTGGPWTTTNLNNLQGGIYLYADEDVTGTAYCSIVHVHAYGTAPAAAGGRGHPITRDDEGNQGILEGGITR